MRSLYHHPVVQTLTVELKNFTKDKSRRKITEGHEEKQFGPPGSKRLAVGRRWYGECVK